MGSHTLHPTGHGLKNGNRDLSYPMPTMQWVISCALNFLVITQCHGFYNFSPLRCIIFDELWHYWKHPYSLLFINFINTFFPTGNIKVFSKPVYVDVGFKIMLIKAVSVFSCWNSYMYNINHIVCVGREKRLPIRTRISQNITIS